MRSRFSETHPYVVWSRELAELAEAKRSGSAATENPKSGEWLQKDGILMCKGYMNRRADLDYCSSGVPGDWVPFEFDGQTYFLQPLEGGAEPEPHAIPQPPSARK